MTPRRLPLLSLLLALATGALTTAGGCGSSYGTAPGATDAGTGEAAVGDAGGDAGADGRACSVDLQTDAKNCGRCGHDCLGGTCNAGRCAAFELASVAAPLRRVVVTSEYVYASGVVRVTSDPGGIWRVPTTGGTVERFVTLRDATAMQVLGNDLYFAVDDGAANGTDKFGGLYSCPLAASAPCAPTLVAAAEAPLALTVDHARLIYNDNTPGRGLMAYVPGQPPTLLRTGGNAAVDDADGLYVDGDTVFSTTLVYTVPRRATLFQVLPDGGLVDAYTYESASADVGTLFAGPNALFYSAFDFDPGTNGAGIVRRLARPGVMACDVGGTGVRRPFGIYADEKRVYWSNQGDGKFPYSNGSVVTCEQSGCCTTPEVLWSGAGSPNGLASEGSAIYFVTLGGSIWKIAKP